MEVERRFLYCLQLNLIAQSTDVLEEIHKTSTLFETTGLGFT